MNIQQLQDFVEVCRAGSFAAAARTRDISPSALSRSIASLEEKLGVRLFERSTRKLRVTEEGACFHDTALEVTERLHEAMAELGDTATTPSGRLRISTSTSFGQEVIVPTLPDFLARHPGIDLDVILTDARVDMLADSIDVSVRHGRLSDSSMIARKLCDVSYGLWASQKYIRQSSGVTAENLGSHALIGFTYPAFRDVWTLLRQGRSTEVDVTPRLRLTSAVAIRSLAEAGQGIAILPDWCDPRGLVRIMPSVAVAGLASDPAIWALRPSRTHTPARVRAFLDYLIDLVN